MLRRHLRPSALLLAAGVLLAACSGAAEPAAETPDGAVVASAVAAEDVTVTVHRTEACECCGRYEAYLRELGFTVDEVLHHDLSDLKADMGVPDDERSCHTNEVAGYAAEGHVPAEALLRLVAETPDIDGIALAGMPSGSPGMPGEQEAPFVVTGFFAGEVVVEFGRF